MSVPAVPFIPRISTSKCHGLFHLIFDIFVLACCGKNMPYLDPSNQLLNWIQVTLALAAGDMVLDGDRGSPQPYPKDLIGNWVEILQI